MGKPVLIGHVLAEVLRGWADEAERLAAARSRASLRAAASSPPGAGTALGSCAVAGAVPRPGAASPTLARQTGRYRQVEGTDGYPAGGRPGGESGDCVAGPDEGHPLQRGAVRPRLFL
jgi:hypothetical protein